MKSYSQQPFPVIRQTKDEGATDSCFSFICASIIVKEMIVAELYSNLDRCTVSLIPAFDSNVCQVRLEAIYSPFPTKWLHG